MENVMECVRCFTEKGDDFYANDRTCKECRCALVRRNRAQNIDYYREYDRSRGMLPHRVKAREVYQKTDAGKASCKKSKRKWLNANQDKRAAHVILGNAVRDGRIEKPESCYECGVTECRIHGHHEDYAQPLEVRWVCSKCHRQVHEGLI